MGAVTVFGAAYSVYVRSVRLALAWKGVPYELAEVDVFADGGPPADHWGRHPFGRIPSFRHGDFSLYETGAINRYVDRAFDGPSLTPTDPEQAARMDQILSILDGYAYPSMVWGVFVPLRDTPSDAAPDGAAIRQSLDRASRCLDAVAALSREGPWLLGETITLADLHALPMLVYFRMTDEGAAAVESRPIWSEWLRRANATPAAAATRFPLEVAGS